MRTLCLPRSFYLNPEDQLITTTLSPEAASAFLRTRSDGRFEYLCFRGRAAKPCQHFLARSQENALEQISKFYAEETKVLEWRVQRRQQRKDNLASAKATFKGLPGSVFVQSWGWEQTNISCFQMLRRLSPSKIEAVEIECRATEELVGPMSDHCRPDPLSQDQAEKLPKIIMAIDAPESVRVPGTAGYSWGQSAGLWDGSSSYFRSWYA